MEYRVTANELKATLAAWDAVLPGRGKIRLIACGGTALSLLGYKESTKDVDFLVPDVKECDRLVRFLERAGYEQRTARGWKRPDETIIYELYPGKRIFTTELLTSPLAPRGHRKIWEGKKISLGALNAIDLIISKLFRGTEQDYEDCLTVLRHEDVDLRRLKQRYAETASFDTGEPRLLGNLEHFLNRAYQSGLGGGTT